MYAIVVLICLIYGVLSLILFFKVWGMTNDVRELKEALLFEVQKKNKESNLSYNSIQNAKKELADVEKQDEAELSLKEALEHQFVVAVKKYKVQCATNSVSKEKYQVGVQSIVKAYQRKAGEKLGYGIEDVVNAIGEIFSIVFCVKTDALKLCLDFFGSSFPCIYNKLLAKDSANLSISIL